MCDPDPRAIEDPSPGIPGAIATLLKPLYLLSNAKFWLDEIFLWTIVMPLRGLAQLSILFDRFVIDGLVDSIGGVPKALSILPRSFHGGVVPLYAGVMWCGVVAAIVVILSLY